MILIVLIYNDLDDWQQQCIVLIPRSAAWAALVCAWGGLCWQPAKNTVCPVFRIWEMLLAALPCLSQVDMCLSHTFWFSSRAIKGRNHKFTSPFFVVWNCLLCHRSDCWCFEPRVFSLSPPPFSPPFASPLHSWGAGSLAWQKITTFAISLL